MKSQKGVIIGGGSPGGLMTARAVARLICRENRIPWKAN